MTENVNPRITPPPLDESVWVYRGYRMRASEFNTAWVHFYRAEVQKANTWRNRLDTTTNWAIIMASAAITFALSDPSHHHAVILLTLGLTFIFLFTEARRYRYFELWSYRIRLLETDFYAAMLVPPFQPSADWAETLADSLLRPRFPISNWEALGRRFRRNYLGIFAALIAVWVFKLYVYPTPTQTWPDFVERAGIGLISGQYALFGMVIFTLGLVVLGLGTSFLQEAPGEVLPQHRILARLTRQTKPRSNGTIHPRDAWQRPSARRAQCVVMIISEQSQVIADRIMQEMRRGVTALPGEGMYTHQARQVLLCALTETEVDALKRVVQQADPQSFVVVMPAAEVAGGGFANLADAA